MDIYHAFKLAPWTLLKLWQLSFMLFDCYILGLFYVHVCMPECMSVYHVCADAHTGQKRALDPLKLGLQAVRSRCVREEKESI